MGSSAPPSEYDLFDLDDAFDDDAFEVGSGSRGRAPVSCPPPSGSSSRYSFVATRTRETLSMIASPLRADQARKTG